MTTKNQLERPRALTADVQKRILDLIARGASLYASCYVAGTTYDAVMYWRKLHEAGAEHAQAYADFFESIQRAQCLTEVRAVDAVMAGEQNWQSRAWFLERRFPARYAQYKDRPRKVDSTNRREVVREAQKRAEDRKRNRRPDQSSG